MTGSFTVKEAPWPGWLFTWIWPWCFSTMDMSRCRDSLAVSLDDLLTLNPHLSLADILALLRWIGPSIRLH